MLFSDTSGVIALEQKSKRLDQIISDAETWYLISKSETQKYSDIYEKYLSQYEIALKKRWLQDFIPCCELTIVVDNNGTAPATDVRLSLSFPKGSSIIKLRGMPPRVWNTIFPDEPVPQWSELAQQMKKAPQVLMQGSPSAGVIPSSVSQAPAPVRTLMPTTIIYSGNPLGQTSSEFNILPFFPPGLNEINTEDFDKISHHMMHLLPLFVYLPPSARQGFTIEYAIYADELIEPVEGNLKVNWTL